MGSCFAHPVMNRTAITAVSKVKIRFLIICLISVFAKIMKIYWIDILVTSMLLLKIKLLKHLSLADFVGYQRTEFRQAGGIVRLGNP